MGSPCCQLNFKRSFNDSDFKKIAIVTRRFEVFGWVRKTTIYPSVIIILAINLPPPTQKNLTFVFFNLAFNSFISLK